MSALRKGPKKKGRMNVNDYDLTEQQQGRYDKLMEKGGKKRARKFLRRQDRRGNLAAKGSLSTEPVENPEAPMSEPEAAPYQQTQDNVYGAVNQQFENLQNRPAFAPQNLPELPGVQGGFGAQRQAAADAAYNQFSNRMEPRFAEQQQNFEQQMINRGIPMGSEQYEREKSRMEQSQNDARENAMNQAYLTGGQEQSRLFGLASGARGQLYGEQRDQYNIPLEQLQAYSPYYQTGAAGERLDQQLGFQRDERLGSQEFANQQAQQNFGFQKKLANQAHKHQLAQIAAVPRGGGGGGGPMSFEDWRMRQDYMAQLQQQQAFDQAVLQGGAGAPSYQPGFSSGATAGIGAGVGAAIGGMLR